MKKELGLWIDHSEAVIVSISNQGEEVKRIRSDVEPHDRFSANAPGGRPEDRRDRRFGEHLHQYYTEVIKAIREADSILIIGPGEAKGELEKFLELEKLSGRIVGLESADKLTEPQIVAKVRHFFLK
jgi:stalled ribosome rescue protein Dom34